MSQQTRAVRLAVLSAVFAAAAVAEAAVIDPQWVTRVPADTALTAGLAGIVVDGAGVTYLTGITGLSPHTDVTTAAIDPDGSVRWSRTWDGPENGGDQARGLALGPGGVLYVIGNTPGPGSWARVVLLKYDTATGNLLDVTEYTSGAGYSEHGQSVAVDAAGRVYVAGGTTGDGGDTLVLSFEADGALRWQRSWDGPALAPYSQDSGLKILVGPDGNPVVLMHGVMGSNQPDYVAVKYAAATGDVVWEATWGVSGGDYPRDMEIDAAGDVYVTGTGIDWIDKYSTVKFRASDGSLVWQAYDSAAVDNGAAGLALDAQGGVFVTGAVDPDGDQSNLNDDIYTVKRDAASGAFRWSHRYGASCLWCYDVPADVIADPMGNVFVAGQTSSPPYSSDAILLVLDTATGAERNRGTIDGNANELAGFREMRFDPSYSLRVGGRTYHANTGFVNMTVARYAALGAPPPSCIYGSRANPCRPGTPALTPTLTGGFVR
jgi:hypothetical protein